MTLHLTTGHTEGGVGLVRVWDTRADHSQSLVWEFSPFRSSEGIVLARFVSGEDIVVVDRAGSASLHSLPRRKMTAKTRLKLEHAGADLSPSGKSLYVAGFASGGSLPLFVLDVPSLVVRRALGPGDPGLKARVWGLSDSEVLVHHQAYRGYPEGLIRIDVSTDRSERLTFTNGPDSSFEASPIEISPERGLGLRCDYASIEQIPRADGVRAVARVQVFDLRDGRPVRSIPVREFKKQHLGFYKSVDRIALGLKAEPGTKEALEARDEVLENIDSFTFCVGEDAFWVAFKYGTVRKCSLDGRRKSAYIAHPGERPDDSLSHYRGIGCQEMKVVLGDAAGDFTIRSSGEPDAPVHLSEQKGWSDDVREPEERLIVLPLSGLVSRREAAVPDVSASSPAALIPVGALRDARSLRKALEECAKKIRNPASLRDGNTLRLAFQTPNGTVSEATFFAAVTGKKACLKPLAAYVEGLIALRPGEPLWQDSETSAGAYAVRALVLSERRFLPVLRRYLKSPIVDLDHAVGYPGSILDEALKKYGWGPDLLGVVAAVGATGTQFAAEFAKSLAQDKDFLAQLSKGRNRATFKAALLEEAEGDPRRISNSLLDLANGAPP